MWMNSLIKKQQFMGIIVNYIGGFYSQIQIDYWIEAFSGKLYIENDLQ